MFCIRCWTHVQQSVGSYAFSDILGYRSFCALYRRIRRGLNILATCWIKGEAGIVANWCKKSERKQPYVTFFLSEWRNPVVMKEAVSISETPVNLYDTARHIIIADGHIHACRLKNMKSNQFSIKIANLQGFTAECISLRFPNFYCLCHSPPPPPTHTRIKMFHELNSPFSWINSNKQILHKVQLMNNTPLWLQQATKYTPTSEPVPVLWQLKYFN
jgi:hypothetical protein